jgi:hypothetical protein
LAYNAIELMAILANLVPVAASWRVLCPNRSGFEGRGVMVDRSGFEGGFGTGEGGSKVLISWTRECGRLRLAAISF